MSEIGSKIIQAVRDAAAAQPEYVYEGMCRYVVDGCPACLVGKALWNLGLISAGLEAYGAINSDGIEGILDHLNIEIDDHERSWLERAQDAQDNDKPWGYAVQWADDYDESVHAW